MRVGEMRVGEVRRHQSLMQQRRDRLATKSAEERERPGYNR